MAKSKIKKYRAERRTGKGGSPASAVKAKPRKAPKVSSPSVARARKLQGQYLGALRSLSGADRIKVKQVAAEKGVADAVKLALSLKKSGK